MKSVLVYIVVKLHDRKNIALLVEKTWLDFEQNKNLQFSLDLKMRQVFVMLVHFPLFRPRQDLVPYQDRIVKRVDFVNK